jgi:hypothetical protein
MTTLRILTFFLGAIFLIHCREENTLEPIYDVHPDLQPMVDLFISEAAQRGVTIVIPNLILQYDTSLDEQVCGQCSSLGDPAKIQKVIRVNPDISSCWEYAQELETLVFHELGHCLLQRPHLQDTLPNGDPKSLMIEGDLTVYAPCKFVIDQPENCNNLHKRSYYLDELFDPDTPIPGWAK